METKKFQEYKEKFARFEATLTGMDGEALKNLEQEIIKEADEVEKKVRSKVYKLPKKNQDEVAKAIRMLLNKQTIQWQYTLGFVNMYEFWTGTQKEVNYDNLDSTLRTLGQLQFTGYDEWKAVTLINDYFAAIRDEYADDTQEIFFIAEKHNSVMNAMDKLNPDKVNPQITAE